MKLIVAVIRSEYLASVEAALQEQQACLMSVSSVLGSARDPGFTEIYRGREVHVRRPRSRLEIAVDDQYVDAALEALARAASGDYKAFAIDLGTCVQLRDGEREPVALSR